MIKRRDSEWNSVRQKGGLWSAARGWMQCCTEEGLADMAAQTNYNNQSSSLITLCKQHLASKDCHFSHLESGAKLGGEGGKGKGLGTWKALGYDRVR